jgi:hypothetical protein
VENKFYISEIALRTNDTSFSDFNRSIYERALYRADREVAKKYEILQKVLSFQLSDMTNNLEDDMVLDVPDLKDVFLVTVNGNPLNKVSHAIYNHYSMCYYLEYRENQWLFNYALRLEVIGTEDLTNADITEFMSTGITERDAVTPKPTKSLTDKIVIQYTAMPNTNTEIGEFIIPDKYEEERIELALKYIAKLGITKFPPQSEKYQKYAGLFQLLKNNSEIDKYIIKDNAWVAIQPFRFP